MKTLKQLISVLVTIFIASLCAAAWAGAPEKYNLDNQLEKVDEISKYNFMGWETVDTQSFVLQTSTSDYYLIVLSSPSYELPFSESIQIPSAEVKVRPGFNKVIVHDHGSKMSYLIDKIYKFKDSKQVKKIKDQLTGQKK